MPTDITMHFDPRGEVLESARECEAEVFLQYYGNTRQQLDDEYGPYADSSVFLALTAGDGEVVAAMRLLAPGGRAGLKTLVDVGRAPWGIDGSRAAAAAGMDLSTTWEVATLGVRRRTAATDVRSALALYHGLGAVSRINAMSTFVAVLDARVRRLLDGVGLLTRAIPGTTSAPYLGSPASAPVYAHCAPMLDNQRREFPDAYRLVTLGIGLDRVNVPPLEAFRFRRGDEVGAPPSSHPGSDLASGTGRTIAQVSVGMPSMAG